MKPVTPDTELSLLFENQRAVVSPWGASLRRYSFIDEHGQEIDIVWGYSGGSGKRGGQGDVLIPFPGRIGIRERDWRGIEETLVFDRWRYLGTAHTAPEVHDLAATRVDAVKRRIADLHTYEVPEVLVVPIADPARPTAVASSNCHLDHFGKAFGIHSADGAVAHTACVGFGLERITLALFKRHGFDPAKWPVEVRGILEL